MLEIKQISKEAIPAAFERAERYRLMNEPGDAESICYDILNVNPDNKQALILLLLVLSEQFEAGLGQFYRKVVEILPKIQGKYQRWFYEGIVYQRRAKYHLKKQGTGSGWLAYDWFQKAMQCFEKAIEIRPAGNDDAIMRWNACARVINSNKDIRPEPKDKSVYLLE